MDIEPISTNSNITNCSTPPTKNFFNQLLVKDENVDLLNEYLINFSHLLVASDYEEALKLSAHYGTVEIFKLLFTKIYNTTNNNNLMDQFNTIVPPMACSNAKKDLFYNINEIKKYRFSHLYNIAATNSNNGILRYLIEQSIPHDGTVLWKASSLETIDLLRSAGHSLESCLLEANMEFEFELPSHPLFLHLLQCHQLHRYNIDHLILASIKQQKIKQFKYLIDHANIHCHSHVVAIIDNLEMLQYYLEKYPPYIYNSIVDNGYKECFIRSMKLGRLDILKFLIQSFDPTIILLTSIKIKEFKLQLNQCDEYVRVFLQHQVDKNTNPSTMTKKKRKRDRQPHEKRDKEYILFSFLTKI
ncbi:hypothetical protein CYY_007075 [Polysphondylium violaceum]|nr:hypothetical protein CYY_007075 [Polysphondylium violaceum]